MKFTDGNWLVREGYHIHFPRIIHEVEEANGAVTLYAPCKYLNHRGDTLDGPLLTIRISAPIDQVVRVQTWHFKGGKSQYPNFEVFDQGKSIELKESDDSLTFIRIESDNCEKRFCFNFWKCNWNTVAS